MKFHFVIILYCVLNFFSATHSAAQPKFLEVSDLALYKKSRSQLSSEEHWKIKIFGLRMAPLDPLQWAVLKADRTENRHLVPIRPFYLRASEDKDFAFKELKVKFNFKSAGAGSIIKNPHIKESVFDIGLAGVLGERDLEKGYTIRLSAFPPLESGLYEESNGSYRILQKISEQIVTGSEYEVHVVSSSETVTLRINNEIALQQEINVEKGLISLITGWNPVKIKEFEILAGSSENREQPLKRYSGLHVY